MEVKFYDRVDDALLKFAVIVSKHNGKWVFCRHRDRDTFEVPGGRREQGEAIFETAKRELYEETGAQDFTLVPIKVYSVTGKTRVNESGNELFGMLYFADIRSFDPLPASEIGEIALFDRMPREWTYPLIQPILVKKAEAVILERQKA